MFVQETFCAQKNKDKWVINSGFSSHVIGDRKKIITLKKNEGNVTFGDNGKTKIVGKCTLSLDNNKEKI